jgi:hypothetical protein
MVSVLACPRLWAEEGDDMHALLDHVRAPDREPPTRTGESRPTVAAMLADGPLEGASIETEAFEGRPPKIIDVPLDDGRPCRYCLADWVQTGSSAVYTFLYRV